MVDFGDYPAVLMRMLNACIREPSVNMAIFSVSSPSNNTTTDDNSCKRTKSTLTGSGRLDFVQNMEYKLVDLMSCHFERALEEITQNQITYRYNSMKKKVMILQSRLSDITNLVKVKNPSLLLHLQKSGTLSTSSSNSTVGHPTGALSNSGNSGRR